MNENLDERKKKAGENCIKNSTINAIIKSLTVEDNLIKNIKTPANNMTEYTIFVEGKKMSNGLTQFFTREHGKYNGILQYMYYINDV